MVVIVPNQASAAIFALGGCAQPTSVWLHPWIWIIVGIIKRHTPLSLAASLLTSCYRHIDELDMVETSQVVAFRIIEFTLVAFRRAIKEQ
jgi:hypothetical protein